MSLAAAAASEHFAIGTHHGNIAEKIRYIAGHHKRGHHFPCQGPVFDLQSPLYDALDVAATWLKRANEA